jgi:hypothetical protein
LRRALVLLLIPWLTTTVLLPLGALLSKGVLRRSASVFGVAGIQLMFRVRKELKWLPTTVLQRRAHGTRSAERLPIAESFDPRPA